MQFNFDLVVNSFPLLLVGAGVTIKITALSVALGVVIGLFVGIARISRLRILRVLAAVYVDFFRGTPLLVQIFLVYFALPVITGQRVDPFVAAIGSCGINSGAYVAEIFRAGIQSIDKGQMEAGRSLGMTWVQTMRYIIVPQAFKRVIPPLGNEFIALLKDSSLVSVIGFEELTRRGQLIIAKTYGSLEIWISVAVIYLAMTLTISRFVAYLERRYKTDDRHGESEKILWRRRGAQGHRPHDQGEGSRRHHRPVRFGQEHAAALHELPRGADVRQGQRRWYRA